MSCTTTKRSKQAEKRNNKGRKVYIPEQKPVRRKYSRKMKHELDWRQQMEEYLGEKEEDYDDDEDFGYVVKATNDTCRYNREKIPGKVMVDQDEYHEKVEKREDVLVIGRKIVDMRVLLVGEGVIMSLLEEEVRKIKTWTTTKKIKKANGDKEVVGIDEKLHERLEKGLRSRAVYKEKRERMEEGENVQDDDEDVEEEISDKEELQKKLQEEEEEDDMHYGMSMCCFC